MGNSGSSSDDPRYSAAARFSITHHFQICNSKLCPRFFHICRAFTPKGLEDLRSLHASLAAQSGTNAQYVSPDVFKVLFLLPFLRIFQVIPSMSLHMYVYRRILASMGLLGIEFSIWWHTNGRIKGLLMKTSLLLR